MSPLGCGRPSRYGTSGCIPAVVNNTEGSSLGTREALGMAACARSVKNDRYIVRSLSAVSTPNSSPPSLECARGGTRPTRRPTTITVHPLAPAVGLHWRDRAGGGAGRLGSLAPAG